LPEAKKRKTNFTGFALRLWYSKSFHYYLKGSVIQFITIDDIKECLSKSLLKSNQNKADFQKAIQQAKKVRGIRKLIRKEFAAD
jgi:hypothetical protein